MENSIFIHIFAYIVLRNTLFVSKSRFLGSKNFCVNRIYISICTITCQIERMFLTILLHYYHMQYCMYSIFLLKSVIYPIARSILPYHTLIYLPQVTIMFTSTTQCRYDNHLFQGLYSQSLYSCSMRYILKY